MSRRDSDGVPFHDAAAYFSDEEWKLLHVWQKELYQNVMKEIHHALLSLGPLIATTVFSLRAQEKQEPCPTDYQEPEFRLSNNASSKEESLSIFIDHLGEEVGESSTNPTSGHEIISYHIKGEEETYCMNYQDHKGIESISCPKDDASMAFEQFSEKTTPCSTSSANAKLKLIESFDKGKHHGDIIWSEFSQNLGNDKTAQCEMDFKIQTHPNLYERESDDQFHEQNIILKNACQPLTMQDLKPCADAECALTINDTPDIIKLKLTHVEQRLYQCTECERSFSRKGNLHQHERTHMAERLYQCTEFEKNVNQKSEPVMHHQTHGGNSPFQCNECEKSFIRKSHLIRHQKAHLGERPYQCTECGKRFTQKNNLIRHIRTHTGEKPYLCTICNKSFNTRIHLIRHQRTHHSTVC